LAKDSGITTDNSCVLWINGSAGTGKTTIAYTIAEDCRSHGILGASFFCSRDDAECSNTSLIFTTIAYQLGLFNSLFQQELRHIVKSNPSIGYSSPSYQLEQLIVKPLLTLGESFPPCVVVLDALDECKDTRTTSIILSSLSRYVTKLSPIRFLVTSRPEVNIRIAFESSELSSMTHRFILHNIKLSVVQNDIKLYLLEKLAFTRQLYKLDRAWPLTDDVNTLTQKSCGLFIFAATSVKFIEDQTYDNPPSQLRHLLDNTPTEVAMSSPYYVLDELYTQVLTHAYPDIKPESSRRLKTVLGTIVLLQDPLSSLVLEKLLCLEPGTVQRTLMWLHSVVIVPNNVNEVIRLLHPSFFDFITNPLRCKDPKFTINAKIQHTLLARLCLETMKGLRQDMCEIKDPSILNSEVGDLSDRIVKSIPPHLQYACCHWAWHLSEGIVTDEVLKLLEEICLKYLLCWVEACSLLGELRGVLVSLDIMQRVLAVSCHILLTR
jgi:NACHT domain